jgi:hypothetical protein
MFRWWRQRERKTACPPTSAARRRRARCRLSLEVLEDRRVLSTVLPTADTTFTISLFTTVQPAVPMAPVTPFADVTFAGVVARVNAPQTAAWTPFILWGDSTPPSVGLWQQATNGGWEVFGAHTYAQSGVYAVTVSFVALEVLNPGTSPVPMEPSGAIGTVTVNAATDAVSFSTAGTIKLLVSCTVSYSLMVVRVPMIVPPPVANSPPVAEVDQAPAPAGVPKAPAPAALQAISRATAVLLPALSPQTPWTGRIDPGIPGTEIGRLQAGARDSSNAARAESGGVAVGAASGDRGRTQTDASFLDAGGAAARADMGMTDAADASARERRSEVMPALSAGGEFLNEPLAPTSAWHAWAALPEEALLRDTAFLTARSRGGDCEDGGDAFFVGFGHAADAVPLSATEAAAEALDESNHAPERATWGRLTLRIGMACVLFQALHRFAVSVRERKEQSTPVTEAAQPIR